MVGEYTRREALSLSLRPASAVCVLAPAAALGWGVQAGELKSPLTSSFTWQTGWAPVCEWVDSVASKVPGDASVPQRQLPWHMLSLAHAADLPQTPRDTGQMMSGLHSSSVNGRFGQTVRNMSCSLSPPDI